MVEYSISVIITRKKENKTTTNALTYTYKHYERLMCINAGFSMEKKS